MGISNILADRTKDVSRLDHSLGTETGTIPLFKPLGSENLPIKEGPLILKQRSIAGDTLIWGNDTYGKWGSQKWGSTPTTSFILGHPTQGILGTSELGDNLSSWNISRVVNPNNTWREMIRFDTFDDASTGTWDTSNHKWSFSDGDYIKTSSIFYNDTNIVSGKIIIPSENISLGSGATLTYYLSADGGSNWETVTLNEQHNFTNTGDDLRMKITCSGGTAEIAIENSTGASTPIKVQYWTS